MNIAPRSLIAFAFLAFLAPAFASDHADPVRLPMPWELFNDGMPGKTEVRELTAGITDLFVFPVDENDRPISRVRAHEKSLPFSPEERAKLATLSAEQRRELEGLSRQERGDALAKIPAGDPAAAPYLSREQIALLERLGPRERFAATQIDDAERARARALVFILCVRRRIEPGPLALEIAPYTYTIHLDPDAEVQFDTDATERETIRDVYSARARYGGLVGKPEQITSRLRLNDDLTLKEFAPENLGPKDGIAIFPGAGESALRDDPFIFPPFFRSNVVAMAARVPIERFHAAKRSWVIWADTTREGARLDHVGRSLRTQQPRFEAIFNAHPPSAQVAAFEEEVRNPSLRRDLLVRIGIPTLFNHRLWDRTPDVMIYNTAFDCRYPNGRLITDDVAAELAENGDAILQEISYEGVTWPRRTSNDKPFQVKFPFLAAPWTKEEVDKDPLPRPSPAAYDPPALSMRNKLKLVLIALVVLGVPFLLGYVVGKIRASKKWRERYL